MGWRRGDNSIPAFTAKSISVRQLSTALHAFHSGIHPILVERAFGADLVSVADIAEHPKRIEK
jgi:hypothetical protein